MFGLGAGGAMLACLGVMAAGLLGGPGASIAGGGRPPAGAAVAGRGDGAVRHSPGPAAPVVMPPSPTPLAGGTPSGRAHPTGSPSGRPSSPPATASPAPSATNPAGKVPPGHNRTPRPKPTRAH